jgi:hypothetical protein
MDLTRESPNAPKVTQLREILKIFFATGDGFDIANQIRNYLEDAGLDKVNQKSFNIP